MPAVYEDFITWTSGKELEQEIEARFPLYIVDGVFQEDNESTEDSYWCNRKGVLPSLEITAHDVLEVLLYFNVVHYSFDDYYAEDDQFIITLDEIVEAIAEHNKNPSRQWFDPASLCRFYLSDLDKPVYDSARVYYCPEDRLYKQTKLGTRRELWNVREPEIDAQDYLKHLIQELKINY